MNHNFSQTITLRCHEPAKLIALIAQWDLNQASADIMGYMGTRVLADREHDGEYMIIADFGIVGDLFEIVPAMIAELNKA